MSASPDLPLLRFKLNLIRQELADTEPLFKLLSQRDPDHIEIRAAGSILQSVYNGMETVLSLFVDDDGGAEGANWHRGLLDAAGARLSLSGDIRLRLEMLRKFRHKYRHAYGFMLAWSQMRDLFLGLPAMAADFEKTIEEYLGSTSMGDS